jgi:hypothetical protein
MLEITGLDSKSVTKRSFYMDVKEDEWEDYNETVCPVLPNDIVQLKLANGNTPIRIASVFYWGVLDGTIFPKILAYRIVRLSNLKKAVDYFVNEVPNGYDVKEFGGEFIAINPDKLPLVLDKNEGVWRDIFK